MTFAKSLGDRPQLLREEKLQERLQTNINTNTPTEMKRIFYTLIVTSIIFLSACTKPTEACFTFSPTTVTPNTTVTFDASCSENAAYFDWNFGDNTVDTSVTSLTVTHKYTSVGQFTVTLNANRKDGTTLGKNHPTITQVITVQ